MELELSMSRVTARLRGPPGMIIIMMKFPVRVKPDQPVWPTPGAGPRGPGSDSTGGRRLPGRAESRVAGRRRAGRQSGAESGPRLVT